jgi:hypothetical protein
MKRFFNVRFKNVEREVFEATKSYSHGLIQDLGKYYSEYLNCDEKEKEGFRNIIIMRFAEFDESKIKNRELRQFLIRMRGY